MRNTLIVGAVLVMAASPLALAQTKTQPEKTQAPGPAATDSVAGQAAVPDPQRFVERATSANEFEIETSEIALKKATRADVKEFARMMVTDHKKAGEKMKMAIKEAKLQEPKPMFDAKEQESLKKLQSASGADFDRQYVTIQQDAHSEAVALFQSFATGGTDGPVKKVAQELLPNLQKHLQSVQGLASKTSS